MRTIEVEGSLTELDRIVEDFTSIIERYGKYCIVSGYVSILLGMERPTQDVDVVSQLSDPKAFEEDIEKHGFETPLKKGMFQRIFEAGEKIDIFSKKQWYFDFRKATSKWALLSLEKPVAIIKDGRRFFVSPPEIQIPYKIWLGSDKDIKDAAFLYERLKHVIDMEQMKRYAEEMGVELEVIL